MTHEIQLVRDIFGNHQCKVGKILASLAPLPLPLGLVITLRACIRGKVIG